MLNDSTRSISCPWPAADIEHQTAFVAGGKATGNAHVNQAPLFFAGNDFDRITDCALGRRHQGRCIPGNPQRVGGDYPDRAQRVGAQDFAESVQTRKRRLHRRFGQVAAAIQPGAEPNRIARGFDHAHRRAVVPADVQTKTIGAQINRGEHSILSIVLSGAESAPVNITSLFAPSLKIRTATIASSTPKRRG